MTTRLKQRRKNLLSGSDNRLLTPWTSSLARPWNDRFFHTRFKDLNNLIKVKDAYRNDFYEEGSVMPAMNVKEDKEYFEIEFAAPGFDKSDFEISMEDNMLHVHGEKAVSNEPNNTSYSRKEFSYKSFMRSIVLPKTVNVNTNISASYTRGILHIKLLKEKATEVASNKKIIIID
ncbi:Hsp20/alpha crystallin family protein [Tamlana fucoidanivorans]|uniref:Hsp20/alpha crystallin family protein n=1 Tax=Allotamlana fucoidanivorans TaxID=2583814 RepID=A0A5C4SNJ7_9FLAO|nr:Hsp20/alpha crystallin family protein [Tamlana fucoidanivorans]TNJ45220.1 Hsp20/alpha crystallin family protein [Tamlana fucoidanivorans]